MAMLRAKAPDMGILILSGYPEEHYAINLIRQGASGYLNKECDPAGSSEAITIARRGAGTLRPPWLSCWRSSCTARTTHRRTSSCPA